MKKVIKNICITLVVALVAFYLTLPAINITSPGFWVFVIFNLLVYYFLSAMGKQDEIIINEKQIKLPTSKILYFVFGIPAIILVINVWQSPLFQPNAYFTRLLIDETRVFSTDVEEADFAKIPLIDRASSQRLGDRTMGHMADLVSQFVVSDLYTQINHNGEIMRVTPLEYVDIIRWFTNRRDGVKGYVTVNSVTGEANLVRLEEGNGMRYMPSAFFFDNLERHLRFRYPTLVFGRATFNLDEEGNPFWVVPTKRFAGIGLRREVSGVIVVNPVNGDTTRYRLADIPTWVDHVFPSELVLDQIDNWGSYRNGFWNSIFGQRNVVSTTEGYNYIAMYDDIYLYTGITSATADASITGFVLVNLRTGEARFYSAPGAKETSAMASAEGLVQEMRYTATFPLLINLNGRPTYLLSLKDNAGLVKMHALVDVEDYQRVVATDSALGIDTAVRRYLAMMGPNIDLNEVNETTIVIQHITSALIDGNTHYYITGRDNRRFQVSIKVDQYLLPFLRVGDSLTVKYASADRILIITDIIDET